MRMKKTEASASYNILKEIHLKLTAFPNEFRDKVGTECNWSTPTYYRKMKAETSSSSPSNAEREKIVALLGESLAELQGYFSSINNGRTNNPT
jgi:hypothetical protein